MRFSVINLGCKVNQAELEKISKDLVALNYQHVQSASQCDFAVLNTCTVTQNADKKSLREARLLCAMENVQRVFVTGCYTELEKNFIEKAGEKCTVVSQSKKMQLAEIADGFLRSQLGFASHEPNYSSRWEAFKSSRAYAGALANTQDVFFQHTRAFVKIQDGCNAFCSYCRIPFARGAPVSRSLADIILQVKRISAANLPEIVLTGINLSTYRDEATKANFCQLVEEILNTAGNSYVRISSLEPHFLGESFLNLITHPALVPHFHLPLQASSNHILKLMGRQYSVEEYKNLLVGIRERLPKFSVSTDIITGHPEETPEDFLGGVEFIESCKFSSLHVFPFSLRPLTKDYDKYATEFKLEHVRAKKSSLEKKSSLNVPITNSLNSSLHVNYKDVIEKSKENTARSSFPIHFSPAFVKGETNVGAKKQENKVESKKKLAEVKLVEGFEKKWRAQSLRKLSDKLSYNYNLLLNRTLQRVVLERKVEESEVALLEFSAEKKACWFCTENCLEHSIKTLLEKAKRNEMAVYYGTSEFYRKGYVFVPANSKLACGKNCRVFLRF